MYLGQGQVITSHSICGMFYNSIYCHLDQWRTNSLGLKTLYLSDTETHAQYLGAVENISCVVNCIDKGNTEGLFA